MNLDNFNFSIGKIVVFKSTHEGPQVNGEKPLVKRSTSRDETIETPKKTEVPKPEKKIEGLDEREVNRLRMGKQFKVGFLRDGV